MKIYKLPVYVFAIIPTLVIRIIKPWVLVRLGILPSLRIGHFAANVELYIYERLAGADLQTKRHVDIFCPEGAQACNDQLEKMWRRSGLLRIWPSWIVIPTMRINRLFPGWHAHVIHHSDRDVCDFREVYPPCLSFTDQEKANGEAGLRAMGVPSGAPYVCLLVRDSTYLMDHYPDCDFSYHNYRDGNIRNYALAATMLADRGYFVIRMGAKAKDVMPCEHPKIIDYAMNGMRTDFMDIYIGAGCKFIITCGCGFDAVPTMFRRPILQVNTAHTTYATTWVKNSLLLFKHHVDAISGVELSLREIFSSGVDNALSSQDYSDKNILLVENTPEEIHDATVEMVERLEGVWQADPIDDGLQQRFWGIYPVGAVDARTERPLHGKIRTRYASGYLRANQEWWLK